MPVNEFLRLTRHVYCDWHARGTGVNVDILPLTAHPQLSPNSAVLSGTSQADFLLAALGAKGVQSSLNCTEGAVGATDALGLVIAQYWNWHSAASAGAVDGARGLARAEAHYAALKSLMKPSSDGKPPTVLLMHASEWATESVLKEVHRVLNQFAVDVSRCAHAA